MMVKLIEIGLYYFIRSRQENGWQTSEEAVDLELTEFMKEIAASGLTLTETERKSVVKDVDAKFYQDYQEWRRR